MVPPNLIREPFCSIIVKTIQGSPVDDRPSTDWLGLPWLHWVCQIYPRNTRILRTGWVVLDLISVGSNSHIS